MRNDTTNYRVRLFHADILWDEHLICTCMSYFSWLTQPMLIPEGAVIPEDVSFTLAFFNFFPFLPRGTGPASPEWFLATLFAEPPHSVGLIRSQINDLILSSPLYVLTQ